MALTEPNRCRYLGMTQHPQTNVVVLSLYSASHVQDISTNVFPTMRKVCNKPNFLTSTSISFPTSKNPIMTRHFKICIYKLWNLDKLHHLASVESIVMRHEQALNPYTKPKLEEEKKNKLTLMLEIFLLHYLEHHCREI